MSLDQILVALCAAGFVIGATLVWSGFSPPDPIAPVRSRRSVTPIVAGALAGLAVFALSGWVVSAVVVSMLSGWAVSKFETRARGGGDTASRVEALASWVENVRDVLQAAGQPIGAIGATAQTCPDVIRPHVQALFARLSAGQPAEVVFRRFADDMDDPLADLVAVGLLIAVTRGAQTNEVLSSLAEQARHLADRRRIVEAERAPMRYQVLIVSAVMSTLLAGLFVFARSDFLDAYDTAAGQTVMAIVLCGYAVLLVRVGRLSRFPSPARFLTLRTGS